MEDSLSMKSNDSATTSDEYEFVNSTSVPIKNKTNVHSSSCSHQQPLLDIANNGNLDDLCKCLGEVLNEDSCNSNECAVKSAMASEEKKSDSTSPEILSETSSPSKPEEAPVSPSSEQIFRARTLPREGVTKVGQSQFYSLPQESNEDLMNADDEGEIVPDGEKHCTIVYGVTYLGQMQIDAPKSKAEILDKMAYLNSGLFKSKDIKVALSVPSNSDGYLMMYDSSGQLISQFGISSVAYFAEGSQNSPQEACFAFTCSSEDDKTNEKPVFYCHLFRCDNPDTVRQVSLKFGKAFNRHVRSMTSSLTGESLPVERERSCNDYTFEVSLQIKEGDGKGGYNTIPFSKIFKLSRNLPKQFCLNVMQVSDKEQVLTIEKCFGLLVGFGRNVKHSDMQLIEEMDRNNVTSSDRQCWIISGTLLPSHPAFQALNTETPRTQSCSYMTVAVDLVITGIQEPVRFVLEVPIKVFPQPLKSWQWMRKPFVQQFILTLKTVPATEEEDLTYKLIALRKTAEVRSRMNFSLTLTNFLRSPTLNPDFDSLMCGDDDPSDEPLLSGTGEVSKDCSAHVLLPWDEMMPKWQQTKTRPKQLESLVREGIPEALRAIVWQRLAGCDDCDDMDEMMNEYRHLITKECPYENEIMRDINRTFPAHESFKEAGDKQETLLRISKAYAVYDEEVGYCQGLSFLAASLLIHMPEEQAFCVLCCIMFDYGLRDLYKENFEQLHMRLFQLERLIADQLPQLWMHFQNNNVELHMFASQWFLTLFTARFPLYFVFHVLDVFLLQGMDSIFKVALGLLTACKKDLLQLDFESILKYFRVQMPKRCQSEDVSRSIVSYACTLKVKKLKKYQQDWVTSKELESATSKVYTDIEEDKKLLEHFEFLEQSMDDLCKAVEERNIFDDEILEMKKKLSRKLKETQDTLERHFEAKGNPEFRLQRSQDANKEAAYEETIMYYKRELQKAHEDIASKTAIITEYKKICQRINTEAAEAKSAMMSKSESHNCPCGDARCGDPEPDSKVEKKDDSKEKEEVVGEKELHERVGELELELAEAKLARVEAECKAQDLAHQLQNAVAEIQGRPSWAPWIAKTLSSIKEAANNKIPAQVSGSVRRESAPAPHPHSRPTNRLRTSSSVEWYPQDIERPTSMPVHPISPTPVLENIPPAAANTI